MSSFIVNNISLTTLLQPYVSGDILRPTATNILSSGSDIRLLFAGRDNKPSNSPSTTNYFVNGVDLSNIFNKINASYDVTITGSFVYDKSAKTATIVSRSPTNVSAPTVASRTNVGTYVASLLITLPGNYIPGTYSGTLIITARPITISFGNSVTFTGDPIDVQSNFTSVTSGSFPSGVTYSVSPSTITSAGTYDYTQFSISIVGDSISNYSILTNGSFTISPAELSVVVYGEKLYDGTSSFPTFYTSPPGYEYLIILNSVFSVGEYPASGLNIQSSSPNYNVIFVSGSYVIYVNLNIAISYPGTPIYAGSSTDYLPSITVTPSAYSSFISIIPPGKTYPGTYYGYDFNYSNSNATLYRVTSYSGSMTIVPFSGTIDITQTVDSQGIGNPINISSGTISPSLPPGVGYTLSPTTVTDPGGGSYPKYISAASITWTIGITGDNIAYYNISVTGTITILAPPT